MKFPLLYKDCFSSPHQEMICGKRVLFSWNQSVNAKDVSWGKVRMSYPCKRTYYYLG